LSSEVEVEVEVEVKSDFLKENKSRW